VRRQYAPYFTGFQLSAPACHALDELLRECRSEGIRAALVVMPEGTAFRSLYSPDAWARIESLLKMLHQEFGVPVINAREWIADDGFSDSHHLVAHAAAAFSARLAREVAGPLLRDVPADSRLAGK
jgi:hypothetical protein